MNDIRNMASAFEAVKIAMTQDKNGHVLRLSIHPSDTPEDIMRDPVGTRYQVALVRLNDQGEPTPSQQSADGDKAVKVAGALCADSRFQEWLFTSGKIDEISEQLAAGFVREFCGVASRRELKLNSEARTRLYQLRDDFADDLRRGMNEVFRSR